MAVVPVRSRLGQGTGAFVVVIGAGVAGALGVLSVHHTSYAFGAAVVVLIATLALVDLTLPILLAVPGTLLLARIGGSSTNLSVSDALLFVATLCALLRFRLREDPALRKLLFLVGIYEAAAIVGVVDHPYRADIVEWFHEAFLAGGSLILGWVLGREGRARPALLALLVGASLLSLWAFGESALHHFKPAYLPGGYQKNGIGVLVGLALLVALANPSYLGLKPRARRVILLCCTAGVGASMSRQAWIGVVVCGLFLLARSAHHRRRLLLASLPVAAGILAYVGLAVQHQAASGNKFNSLNQRLTWYHDSLKLFHLSPWLGEGFRWWYTGRFSFAFQPPNAEIEVLTEVGLLGLVAFLVLLVASLRCLWRLAPLVGWLPFAVILARVIEAQFDIFWVTATASLPWMIAGIGMGAALRAHTGASADSTRVHLVTSAGQGARAP